MNPFKRILNLEKRVIDLEQNLGDKTYRILCLEQPFMFKIGDKVIYNYNCSAITEVKGIVVARKFDRNVYYGITSVIDKIYTVYRPDENTITEIDEKYIRYEEA